jgi:hypothetical protein
MACPDYIKRACNIIRNVNLFMLFVITLMAIFAINNYNQCKSKDPNYTNDNSLTKIGYYTSIAILSVSLLFWAIIIFDFDIMKKLLGENVCNTRGGYPENTFSFGKRRRR